MNYTEDMHVALPGKILSYDAATQTADVELQIQRKLPMSQGDYTEESLTDLMNVPVMFPRSKDFFISFPLAAGDFGMVVFNEMSINQWRSLGADCDPKDVGRHTLDGAVFIPGLVPNSEALSSDHDVSSTNMVIGKRYDSESVPPAQKPVIEIGDNTITIADHLTVDLTVI